MSKRRVKRQNVSVIGLFTLAGRHEKMDDVFVYHECQSTSWSHSAKNKNKQTQSKQRLPRIPFTMFVRLFVFSYAFPIRFVYMFVCLFYKCLSYTFCLVVRFNCIKRAVFKALIFPAYSINIVIVIFNKWPPLLSDLSHPFAVHGGFALLFIFTCVN